MEYIEGHSCAEILRDDGWVEVRRGDLDHRAGLRGADYAHRHGVVHRDVKPGNLLRAREGDVKLADFGIAKATEQSSITQVGSVLGTAAYLAPEQARGEEAGPRADLYALGVVTYQLISGRLPYEATLADRARAQAAARGAAAARRARRRGHTRAGRRRRDRARARPARSLPDGQRDAPRPGRRRQRHPADRPSETASARAASGGTPRRRPFSPTGRRARAPPRGRRDARARGRSRARRPRQRRPELLRAAGAAAGARRRCCSG